METRKKLTEVQANAILNSQARFNEAVKVFNEAKENLDNIRLIVFDAQQIPLDAEVKMDTNTQELVYESNEE